jgi:hypothetical protein
MCRRFDGGYAVYTVVPRSQVICSQLICPERSPVLVTETLQSAYGNMTTGLDLKSGQIRTPHAGSTKARSETTMTQADPAAPTHSLTELPEGSKLQAVTAVPVEVAGRRALRVELADGVTLEGKPGVDYVDMPTFVIIPASFTNGTIEVNILCRLNGKGPAPPGPSPAPPTASLPMTTALRRSTCAP